jgi:HK97 family phage portal protein
MWPFRKRTQDRATFQIGDLAAPPTWAGVPVGGDQALRLSGMWACVRLLSESVSTLPLHVRREGEREPLALPPLLQRPAAGMPLHEWLEAVMRSLLLRGNCYGVVTDRSGATLLPSQVELANPDLVAVRYTDDGIEYRVGGQRVERENIWHVRAYVQPGSLVGLSPVEYCRQQVALGLAAEKYGAQWFGEGGVPYGLLTNDDAHYVGIDKAQEIHDIWRDARRNNKTAVLTGWRYHPLSVKPEESQFIETTKANLASICRIYGVPPEMVAGEAGNSLTYANVEQRSIDFLTYGLRPWLHRLETAIGALLPRGQYCRFNSGALLKPTLRDRYEAHKVAIEAGFLTVNEVRELEDRPPLAAPTPKPEEAAA